MLLGWAALPITDRRWAAPLSAVALGFGLFVGVGIGPGAAGTFATGAAQVIEIPLFGGDESDGGGTTAQVAPSTSAGGGESEPAPSPPESSSFGGEELEAPAPTEAEPEPPVEEPEPPVEESEPEEPVLTGAVVHLNPVAGSYTLAETSGALDVVHASKLPRVTTRLSVPVRSVADGTFSEAGTRIRLAAQKRAKLEGTVTYVDATPTAPAYAVSRRGVSLLVHVHPEPAGTPPQLPALGASATVAVDIERPPIAGQPEATDAPAEAPSVPTEVAPQQPPASCAPDPARLTEPALRPRAVLWQRWVRVAGEPLAFGEFTGIVTALCPESGQLALSADDIRESGADLVFDLSPQREIDLTNVRVGDAVLATGEIAADGKLSLTGLEPAFSQAVHSAFTSP